MGYDEKRDDDDGKSRSRKCRGGGANDGRVGECGRLGLRVCYCIGLDPFTAGVTFICLEFCPVAGALSTVE